MDNQTSKMLIRLRIISKIPENGRLNTYDNKLSLYDNSWRQWIIRNYKLDSKESTKIRLESFYSDVLRKTNELMKSKDEYDLLFQFNKQLEKSVKGLEMLKDTTYKEDARLTSFFDSLINISAASLVPPYKERGLLRGKSSAIPLVEDPSKD